MRTWDHACIIHVLMFMCTVEGTLGLGGHVVIGVVRLVARFHHAYAIPSVEFFPSGFCSPKLCTCSQTVFCGRQISPVTKLLHTFASRKRVI